MSKVAFFDFSDSEIKNFKKLSIKALVLFGSQAQGLASQSSDFDIGVIVGDGKVLYRENQRKEIYDFLYDIFSGKINQLSNIDIVFLETAPAELRAHVMKYGKLIFKDSSNIFADFKAQVMEQNADFAPLQYIFHSGILTQIH